EDSSLLIAVTSSDALNVPHQNTIPTKPRSTSGNKPKLSITPPKFPSSLFTSSGSPRSASSHQASSSQESPERIAVDKEKHLSPHDEKKHPSPREVKKRSMFQKRPSYTHGASTPQRKISSEEKTDKPHGEKHGKKPDTKTAVIKDQSNATDKK
ncbi:MAG: hypothetical protein K2X98_01280, partial [Alphaproteobacteria bacterium]|nr:hypothetical protein [Alphaproteobacteria bacterium]